MDIHNATEQAYRNGYEAGKMDAEPKWIPMEERPPNWDDFDDRIGTACYIAKKVWDNKNICYKTVVDYAIWNGRHFVHGSGWGCSIPIDDVTHWMPTPNPPTE